MDGIVDYDPSRAPGKRGKFIAGYGEYRAARLRKVQPTGALAWIIDLLWAVAFPVGLGVVISAVAVACLEIDDVSDWVRDNPVSPQVVSSLSTLVAFIVSLRLGQNLTENAASINAFGGVCGACISIAVWSRSLVNRNDFEYVTLPDGKGGFYQTTRLGLILASMPFVVKYTYRGAKDIRFEELPVAGDPELLARANLLTETRDGFTTVSDFTALLMMVGEYIDDLEEKDKIKGNEMSTLLGQINALSASEGAISGSVTFSYPQILNWLLYAVFIAWLGLLSLTDIGPASGWNALWYVGLLSLASVGLFALSSRYANPFQIRSKNSTQTPLIGIACREAEIAIDSIFAWRGRINALKADPVASGSWLNPAALGRRR